MPGTHAGGQRPEKYVAEFVETVMERARDYAIQIGSI